MLLGFAALLSIAVGMALGLLGGGGSILILPMLVDVLHVEAKSAIALSLLVVGVTSAAAMLAHAWARRVDWGTGLTMGLAGMTGAYAGGSVARFVPAGALLTLFAVLMLFSATRMLRGSDGAAPPPPRGATATPGKLARILALGVSVGAVAGLVGAGGGFLVVPALVLFGGLPMPRAVGTSLLVLAMQSFAGLAGHLGHLALDRELAAVLCAAAIFGSLAGARLGRRVDAGALRRGFGWLLLALGSLFLLQRVPLEPLLAYPGRVLAAIAIAIAAAAAILVRNHLFPRGIDHA
jgi:uncharacterized protein